MHFIYNVLRGFKKFHFAYYTIIFLLGCTKNKRDILIPTIYDLPTNATVRAMAGTPEGYVFVGGESDGEGFVITSDSLLTSFQIRRADFPYGLYSIAKVGKRYIIGAGEAQIVYTEDFNSFSNHIFLEENWPNEQYKLPLKNICIAPDKTWYIAGGRGFQFGLVFVSHDSAQTWKPKEFANEIHSITPTDEGVAAVGNGIVVTSADSGKTWQRQRLNNVLLTGAAKDLCHTLNGDFYIPNSGYSEFQKEKVQGRANYLTKLIMINHHSISHVALGHQGNLVFRNKSGSLVPAKIEGEPRLTDGLLHRNRQVLLSAEGGKLYLVNLSK